MKTKPDECNLCTNQVFTAYCLDKYGYVCYTCFYKGLYEEIKENT